MSSQLDDDLARSRIGDRTEAIRNTAELDSVDPDTSELYRSGYGSVESVKSLASESDGSRSTQDSDVGLTGSDTPGELGQQLQETGSPELELPFDLFLCSIAQTAQLPSEKTIKRVVPDLAVLAGSDLTEMPEPMADEERSTTRTTERRTAACTRVADATKDDGDNDDDNSDSDDSSDEGYKPPGHRLPRHYDRRRKAKRHSRIQGKASRRRSRRRSPQLWTFLLDALCDSRYNPSLVRWVDKRRGIFRLTNNKKLAQIWGQRTGKDPKKPMNYEKFSRAIRYYYKQLVILSVSGRLTYQFGPNARGWREKSRRSDVE